MAALGLIAGLMVIFHLSPGQGLDPDKMWNLGGLAILCGIVGAKVLLILNDWSFYAQHPSMIFSREVLLQSGGVFSGGVVLALVVCFWYARHAHIPFLRGADVFAPGLALGHAFGRLGCFAAGCCYGSHTTMPWGVVFTNPIAHQLVGTPLGEALHPTQLYEFVVEMINFPILFWLVGRKKFEGQVMGLYMFLYGIERFVIEFFRGDGGRGEVFGGAITATQLIAIGLVIGGGLIWMVRRPLRVPQPLAAASAAR